MRTIELTYHVPAPPDVVFERLTDFEQLTRWRSLERLRLEPDGRLQVGTRIHTAVKGPVQTMRFVNEVTLLDRERRAYDDRSLE